MVGRHKQNQIRALRFESFYFSVFASFRLAALQNKNPHLFSTGKDLYLIQ
jgi:hypothetical protein